MTEAQRRMLNSVCGDLARSIQWHGWKLSKDDWRHLMSGLASGMRIMRGWDYGDGQAPGLILLGRSSQELTRSQAKDAITLGIHLGDNPDTQGLTSPPVRWSPATLHGMGFTDQDLA